MKTVVISLVSSPERRAAAQKELEKHNVDFEFLDAWTGDAAVKAGVISCDEKRYAIRTGSRPTSGNIGCFASHLTAWRMAVELDQPLMVLEDDFTLHSHFNKAVAQAERWLPKHGMIRLYSADFKGVLVDSEGDFELRRFKKSPRTGLGYLISPEAAAKLVNRLDKMIEPIDFYTKRFWVTKQRDYQIYPNAMDHSELSEEPITKPGNRVPRTLSFRLQRLMDQIIHSTGRKFYNLIFALHNLLRPGNKI